MYFLAMLSSFLTQKDPPDGGSEGWKVDNS